MAKADDIMRLGRRDLRFIYRPGVYILTRTWPDGRAAAVRVGCSDNIGRDAKVGGGDFSMAEREGLEEAIVVIETDPRARRRLTEAVAAALLPLVEAPSDNSSKPANDRIVR